MTIKTIIRQCGICGAIVYIEIAVDDHVGVPSGEPDKHDEWHERRGER